MDLFALLIIIGTLALVGELFLPSGIVGALGIGLIVSGILIMLNFEQSLAFIIGFITSVLAVIAILIYNKYLQKQPIKTGGESLIGKFAIVKKTFKNGRGLVIVNSEVWSCQSVNGKNYKEGEKVKIIGFEGVYLKTE